MAKVLFLYTTDESKEGEMLKDYLQAKIGTRVNFINIVDFLAEDSELSSELIESKCVVLICSEKTAELIKEGGKEMEDGFITFDGEVIRDFIQNKQYLQKFLLVYFGEASRDQWIPNDLDRRRMFYIEGNIQEGNPALSHIMDAIKTLVTQGTYGH